MLLYTWIDKRPVNDQWLGQVHDLTIMNHFKILREVLHTRKMLIRICYLNNDFSIIDYINHIKDHFHFCIFSSHLVL